MPIGAADTWFSYFFFAQRGQGYLSYLFFLPIGASDTCLFFFPPIAHRGLGYLQWFTLCLKFGPSVEWIHFLTRLVFGPSGPRIPARIIFFSFAHRGLGYLLWFFFLAHRGCGYLLSFLFFITRQDFHGCKYVGSVGCCIICNFCTILAADRLVVCEWFFCLPRGMTCNSAKWVLRPWWKSARHVRVAANSAGGSWVC